MIGKWVLHIVVLLYSRLVFKGTCVVNGFFLYPHVSGFSFYVVLIKLHSFVHSCYQLFIYNFGNS